MDQPQNATPEPTATITPAPAEAPAPAAASPMAPLPADAPWWARWMVGNARQAWRWGSVRWPAFCAIGCEIYAQYGDQILAYIPESWRPHLLAAAFGLTIILRVINLSKVQK